MSVSLQRRLVVVVDCVSSLLLAGGGMLAFTVLGIDYNPSTGDCQFLILVSDCTTCASWSVSVIGDAIVGAVVRTRTIPDPTI
jgi:hypothetical protein